MSAGGEDAQMRGCRDNLFLRSAWEHPFDRSAVRYAEAGKGRGASADAFPRGTRERGNGTPTKHDTPNERTRLEKAPCFSATLI
jgi:hypothetical protein